jgi:hypothetical protein
VVGCCKHDVANRLQALYALTYLMCAPFSCAAQVAAELGVHYEDQEYMLEPDHGQWAEDIAFGAAKDDPYFGQCDTSRRDQTELSD